MLLRLLVLGVLDWDVAATGPWGKMIPCLYYAMKNWNHTSWHCSWVPWGWPPSFPSPHLVLDGRCQWGKGSVHFRLTPGNWNTSHLALFLLLSQCIFQMAEEHPSYHVNWDIMAQNPLTISPLLPTLPSYPLLQAYQFLYRFLNIVILFTIPATSLLRRHFIGLLFQVWCKIWPYIFPRVSLPHYFHLLRFLCLLQYFFPECSTKLSYVSIIFYTLQHNTIYHFHSTLP